MRLEIHRDGALVVTVPARMRPEFVEKFLTEKFQWIQKKLAELKDRAAKRPTLALVGSYLENKNQARDLVIRKIEHFNRFYQFGFNKISIRNQKTRWGSCSRRGNLNFNYKIALLPEKLADYIIVHELCHLKEFNHSRNFWSLVARTFPDYRELRRELKRYELRG